MLKLNVCQVVCSSVRMDTNIFIGTSVLNCQTLKTLFLQILLFKMIFQENWVLYIFSALPVGKMWAYMVRYYCPNTVFRCQLACEGLNHTSNAKCSLFFGLKVAFTQDIFILKRTKFFEMRTVHHIEICEKIWNA